MLNAFSYSSKEKRMFLTLGSAKEYKDRKKFAFFPVQIGYTNNDERGGSPKYVWLRWYTLDRWGSCFTRRYKEMNYSYQTL